MRNDIACIIILYNPADKVLYNVETYKNIFSHIILVDNSITSLEGKIIESNKITYISNKANLGIAKALNIGISEAIKKSLKYALFLDQDSNLSEKAFVVLLEAIDLLRENKWGIISAYQKDPKYDVQNKNSGTKEVLTTITSGSILNLEAYRNSGPFIDDLFIDYVDFEYCLRLRKNGYKIYQCNDAILDHHLGNMETKHVFNKSFSVTHHSLVRYYYRTRNRFYVMNRYKKDFPGFVRQDRRLLITDLLKIIFYEKHKLLKIKYIFKGIVDYKRNRFGKII